MSEVTELYANVKDNPEIKDFIQNCRQKQLSYEELCCALLGADVEVRRLQVELNILRAALTLDIGSFKPKTTEEKLH